MQTHAHNVDFERRFSYTSSQSEAKKTSSNEIAEQIAEFEKRGGKITAIPTGIGSLHAGEVIASEESHGMAVPRNSKRNQQTKTAPNSPLITVIEASDLSGIGRSTIAKMIKTGALKAVKKQNCRAHFVKRKDVLELKNQKTKGEK